MLGRECPPVPVPAEDRLKILGVTEAVAIHGRSGGNGRDGLAWSAASWFPVLVDVSPCRGFQLMKASGV